MEDPPTPMLTSNMQLTSFNYPSKFQILYNIIIKQTEVAAL